MATDRKRTKLRPKTRHPLRWKMELSPWMACLGVWLGLIAEVIWKGNILWLGEGAIVGFIVGLLCDTALFLYRRREDRLWRSTHPGIRPGARPF